MVGKDIPALRIIAFPQQPLQSAAIKNIVAQDQRYFIIANKLLTQYKGLCKSVRNFLYFILKIAAQTVAIFYYFRKEMGMRIAVFSSLMFLTSGRILIYESFYGLIDITYSMIVFIFIMHVYRSFMQGKLLKLFIIGYMLIALSFMMKGLPSILFLGITLLVLFISNKKFKLLFHWGHYLGILLFLLIVGGYYVLYFSRNSISPQEMLSVVFGESTRRTVVKFGFWNTVLHFFSYPFEVLYHFLPWGILAILFFRKGTLKKIIKQPFIRYLSLVFIGNIIIYWTSPEVFPRYILMLIPLLFGVFVYLYFDQKSKPGIQVKIVEWILGALVTLSILVGFIPLFVELPLEIPNLYFYVVLLIILFSALSYFYWKYKENRLLWVVLLLLISRIGFDLIVIPVRISESEEVEGRSLAKEIIDQASGHELRFWWSPEFEPGSYYGYRVTSYRFNYYLFLYRNEAFQTVKERDPDILYISKLGFLHTEDIEIIKTFGPPGQPSNLALFRFRSLKNLLPD